MLNGDNVIKVQLSFHEEIDQPHYEKIPMDLNFSPLENFFKQSDLLNTKTENPTTSTNIVVKTMPVIIPGSSEKNLEKNKKKHHKRRRKILAQTLPENGLEAAMERRLQQELSPDSQTFTVGSLQKKAPVPWPTALTTSPDSKNRNRSEKRQSINWPLVPQYHHRFSEDDQDDIFNMDDNFYNSSDCDDNNDDYMQY